MSSNDLDEVSRTIGIDLNGLRAKYQGIQAGTAPKEDSEKAKAAAEAFRKLDKYSACAECGGSGVKKTVYNFITMEANCDSCDGDGLLIKAVNEIERNFVQVDSSKGDDKDDQVESVVTESVTTEMEVNEDNNMSL